MSPGKESDNSAGFLGSMPISSIMTKNVKTAKDDQSLYEVCKIIHDNKIGSVWSLRNAGKK